MISAGQRGVRQQDRAEDRLLGLEVLRRRDRPVGHAGRAVAVAVAVAMRSGALIEAIESRSGPDRTYVLSRYVRETSRRRPDASGRLARRRGLRGRPPVEAALARRCATSARRPSS